jgi:cell wall-associated NlpC family hydrolase
MKTKFIIYPAVITAAALLLLPSCSTLPWEDRVAGTSQVSGIQEDLLEHAESYIGIESGALRTDDRNYTLDCSGVVLAIYYNAGIELEKCYSMYTGNGVKRIYSCLRDNKLIFNTKSPEPGDLIFWDNTYDRDGDGKFNDYFSHIGMVISVDEEGTIIYVHHNYRQGIIYERMNLYKPDDTSLNSPMRMRGSPPAPEGQYLASHLVRVFGRAWQLPRQFFR